MNKLINEEIKYNGKRFNVVQKVYETKKGEKYIRDCVETKNAVVILTIDKDDNVYFVKQYREVIGIETLELPAGIIDEGETPIEAAKRELEEETGLIAKNILYLGEFYPSCGFTNEKIYMYLATKLSNGKAKIDSEEVINSVEKIPLEQCYEMLKNNELIHATQNVAFSLYYFKFLKKL